MITIPTIGVAQKAVNCGNISGIKTDKFKKFGMPLIEECFANLECRVVDTRMLTDYCFFVLEVVKAWIDPKVKNSRIIHHWNRGIFTVAGKKLN